MKNYDLTLSDISPKLAKEVKKVNTEIAFKEWLKDNNYNPTIGTFKSPNGLTDYHTKIDDRGHGVLYSTVELCIEFMYR